LRDVTIRFRLGRRCNARSLELSGARIKEVAIPRPEQASRVAPAASVAGGRGRRLDVTVVIPVYNNAATLARLCDQLKAALRADGIAFELLFVNDGSQDDSAEKLAALAKAHDEVTVVELKDNFGQQVALLSGLSLAHGESCVVMDADLQDPPLAVPLLWRARSPSIAAVFAGRRGRSQSPGRQLTSLLYRTLLNILTGLPRDASMFVLMEQSLVRAVVAFPTRHPWLTAMIGCLGVRTTSVPVRRMMRPVGRSGYTSLARVRAALSGLACVFGYRLGTSKEPYLQSRAGQIVGAVTTARVVSEGVRHAAQS
jgi:polyisoprenyl-phosphate glycosyltransferase